MALPTLLYGCRNWVLLQEDRWTATAEIKLVRFVVGYTMYEQKTNEEIRKELNIYNLSEISIDYRHKWKKHLLRMNDTHITRLVYEYIPTGRTDLDRPRRRWKDQHQ
jgi:hypothetical protein